jgi:predicted nuclease with TOPRIM domain
MSKLSDRCEERKNEAQALADKFNAEKAEIDKLRGEANQREKENAIVYEQFMVKNSQYAELLGLVKEEEGVETTSEVVE